VRVQRDSDGKIVKVTVGPDSVGYNLIKDAICFGGSVLTASDIGP
jgi:hypothetical protein